MRRRPRLDGVDDEGGSWKPRCGCWASATSCSRSTIRAFPRTTRRTSGAGLRTPRAGADFLRFVRDLGFNGRPAGAAGRPPPTTRLRTTAPSSRGARCSIALAPAGRGRPLWRAPPPRVAPGDRRGAASWQRGSRAARPCLPRAARRAPRRRRVVRGHGGVLGELGATNSFRPRAPPRRVHAAERGVAREADGLYGPLCAEHRSGWFLRLVWRAGSGPAPLRAWPWRGGRVRGAQESAPRPVPRRAPLLRLLPAPRARAARGAPGGDGRSRAQALRRSADRLLASRMPGPINRSSSGAI